jgi:hypothetical protein
MIPRFGIILGIYGVGHGIFSNLLSRGQEVRFRINTSLEVLLEAMLLRYLNSSTAYSLPREENTASQVGGIDADFLGKP